MKIHLAVDTAKEEEIKKAMMILAGILYQAGVSVDLCHYCDACNAKKEEKEKPPKQETAKDIPPNDVKPKKPDTPAATPSTKTFEDLQNLAVKIKHTYDAATVKSWYLLFGHGFKKTSDVSAMEPEKPGIIDRVYAHLEDMLAKEADKNV
jgi:hypothetical protein